MKIVDVKICASQVFGEGGFAQLRRLKIQNVRQDGSLSPIYTLDLLERPRRIDAVSILAYQPQVNSGEVQLLLRQGIRPVARLGRAGQPTRDGVEPALEHIEVVSGLLEEEDAGELGIKHRAAAELFEEVGLRVDPEQVEPLGPPVYLSIGIMAERIYFCCVATQLSNITTADGDGSFMEEGGSSIICTLSEALERCRRGQIQDAKTEVAIRRLGEQLAK